MVGLGVGGFDVVGGVFGGILMLGLELALAASAFGVGIAEIGNGNIVLGHNVKHVAGICPITLKSGG